MGSYDPDLAARSVRELAAVTDANLANGVRAAAAVVVDRADALRATGWPREPVERAAYATVEAARIGLARLPVDAPVRDVVAVVAPILGQWWPRHPGRAEDLAAAVDRLRAAALDRPALVRHSRRLTRH